MNRGSRHWRIAMLALLLGASGAGRAGDRLELQGLLDLRAVYADGLTSFLYGGSGRLRFDADHEGVRVGRLMLAGRYRISDVWTFNAVGGSWADPDKHPVDLTEAWFDARPFPRGPVRYRLRVGAFQLPASLENRAVGWSTPYSLSSSAINTWLGEEIRILGSELEAKWIGASQGYFGEVAVQAAVFGWNDPAGDLIASRGWAIGERQSTLFGGLGRPRESFYREIDGRPGYYAGLSWRHHDQWEVRALRYDNRADPGATNSDDIAWRTQFTSLGVRWEPDERWTVIAQTMQGQTYVGGDAVPQEQYAESFRSWFVLGSRQWGAGRLTLRYDRFSTHQHSGEYSPFTDDDGHGLMLAYLYDFDAHWQAVGEWQQVSSRFPPRVLYGDPVAAREKLLQLSVRYRFKLQR
ncbi:MAG: hypothetical protein U1F35_09795 [Steroidobacteraceae bacterium]